MAADYSDLPVPSKASTDWSDLPAPPKTADTGITKKDVGRAAVGAAGGFAKGLAKGAVGLVKSIPETVKMAAPTEKYPFLFGGATQAGVELGKALPQVYEKRGEIAEAAKKKLQEYKAAPVEQKFSIPSELAGEAFMFIAGPTTMVKGASALSRLGNVYKALKLSKSAEGDRLAAALKTKMTGTAADVIRNQEKALERSSGKLETIGKAEQQLGARGTVAGERQAAREKDISQSLDKISKNKNVLPEDVGSVIQNEGRGNVQKLKETRQERAITEIKDPAFESARKKEGSGDYIATNPNSANEFNSVINEIETQIARAPAGYRTELERRFGSLRGDKVKLTDAEQRVENLRASLENRTPVTEKVRPLTLDQAEVLRRMLNDKNVAMVEGFAALDVNRMKSLGERLRAAMGAYEPGLAKYLEKYRDLSTPITKALAGRGGALTEVEMMEAENAMFSADKTAATRYFLDGSAEKAQRLLDLTGGKTPKLMQAVKGYFRSQLQGMSAKEAESFAAKQQGFFRVFPELRGQVQQVVADKARFEQTTAAAREAAKASETRLRGERAQVEAQARPIEQMSERYKMNLNRLQEASPQQSEGIARTMIDDLRKDKIINDATHRSLLGELQKINQTYKDINQAKSMRDAFMRKVGLYSGYGVAGTTGYFGIKAIGGG